MEQGNTNLPLINNNFIAKNLQAQSAQTLPASEIIMPENKNIQTKTAEQKDAEIKTALWAIGAMGVAALAIAKRKSIAGYFNKAEKKVATEVKPEVQKLTEKIKPEHTAEMEKASTGFKDAKEDAKQAVEALKAVPLSPTKEELMATCELSQNQYSLALSGKYNDSIEAFEKLLDNEIKRKAELCFIYTEITIADNSLIDCFKKANVKQNDKRAIIIIEKIEKLFNEDGYLKFNNIEPRTLLKNIKQQMTERLGWVFK